MKCNICGNQLNKEFDLGVTALANDFLTSETDEYDEYPLCLCYCESCKNLQLDYFVQTDLLYRNYLYSTPNSKILDAHYEFLIKFMTQSGYINRKTKVIEIGSNAGQFLNLLNRHTNLAIGVEPAANILSTVKKSELEIVNDFFTVPVGEYLRRENGYFDLVIARHCFAHNENPGEMIKAASEVLSDEGLMIVENAYAINTLMNGEFDQIYHEHMYYYSLTSLSKLYSNYGYELVDATIGDVHGGSIVAVFAKLGKRKKSKALLAMKKLEELVLNKQSVRDFVIRSEKNKSNLSDLIKSLNYLGNIVYSYGATAKGNTLLNCMGLSSNELKFCIDSTQVKIGKYLPGSRIPIQSEEFGVDHPPDYYLLTAWNYKSEIIAKVRNSGNYKTRFIIPFPSVHVI